jgi:hypothetical protein
MSALAGRQGLARLATQLGRELAVLTRAALSFRLAPCFLYTESLCMAATGGAEWWPGPAKVLRRLLLAQHRIAGGQLAEAAQALAGARLQLRGWRDWALREALGDVFVQRLARGDSGELVQLLQRCLIASGFSADGGVLRARPHCPFRKRGTDSLSESRIKWMSGSAKRQCDRTLGALPFMPDGNLGLRTVAALGGCRSILRCIWSFPNLPRTKYSHFPFKFHSSSRKRGADISERIVC